MSCLSLHRRAIRSRRLAGALTLWLALPAAWTCAAETPAKDAESARASVVRIVKHDNGYQLLRNGQSHFIRGAVAFDHLDRLKAAGANSIRSTASSLDRAQTLGLSVLVGLRVAGPRRGFDYADAAQVARQLDDARQVVLKAKDHPALLMWALGNELEINTTAQQRVGLWKAINQMAEMVKSVDGNHPVITVLGDKYRTILHELDTYCPALDAVGLNAYVDMLTMPEDVARNRWARPYLVTEFGPRGHWQVPKTAWRMPIEDTSTEKAEFYVKAYRHAIQGRPQCLGSYTFLWTGRHHEKTHTWYPMFLPDGSPTGAVDAMTFAWTGQWPANRCPRIGAEKIRLLPVDGSAPVRIDAVPAAARLRCAVAADDPEGEELKIVWELRPDVADDPNVGGDPEKPSAPIPAAVVSSEGKQAVLQLPAQPGKWRIFVYVYDPHGSAATANLPILTVAR